MAANRGGARQAGGSRQARSPPPGYSVARAAWWAHIRPAPNDARERPAAHPTARAAPPRIHAGPRSRAAGAGLGAADPPRGGGCAVTRRAGRRPGSLECASALRGRRRRRVTSARSVRTRRWRTRASAPRPRHAPASDLHKRPGAGAARAALGGEAGGSGGLGVGGRSPPLARKVPGLGTAALLCQETVRARQAPSPDTRVLSMTSGTPKAL